MITYHVTFKGRQGKAIGKFHEVVLDITLKEPISFGNPNRDLLPLIKAIRDKGYEFNHLWGTPTEVTA